MRLTITILCGTHAGQRFVVACGDCLRIGRTTKADVVIADDPTMSAVHYELHCTEEEKGIVRDLQSRNGLFVNGEQVAEAVLSDGDQIRAGRTFFDVAIQGALKQSSLVKADDETQASNRLDATEMVRPETPTLDDSMLGLNLRHERRQEGDRLYAVVDGSLGQDLIQAAKRGTLRSENLATAGTSPYLSAVAPYLIEVSHDSEFTALWQNMRSRSPGILIESQVEFEELLVHLRSIFCRRDDFGRPSFFRFYDPAQLYAWLKGCTGSQVASFFGCLTSIVLPLDAGSRLLRLTNAQEELVEEEVETV